MGENDISGGVLYAAPLDDSSGWVQIGDVKAFDLSKTDIDPDTVLNDNNEYLKVHQPTEMTFTIKLKTKRNRKTFKKWLMSRGNQRDVAEGICKLVGLMQGRVNYESLYLYILTSGAEFKQNYTPLYSKIYGGTKHET